MTYKVDPLLKISEVASITNTATSTIFEWVRLGKFPKPIKLGSASRWRLSVVEQWLEDQEAKTDADRVHQAAENGHSA